MQIQVATIGIEVLVLVCVALLFVFLGMYSLGWHNGVRSERRRNRWTGDGFRKSCVCCGNECHPGHL